MAKELPAKQKFFQWKKQDSDGLLVTPRSRNDLDVNSFDKSDNVVNFMFSGPETAFKFLKDFKLTRQAKREHWILTETTLTPVERL